MSYIQLIHLISFIFSDNVSDREIKKIEDNVDKKELDSIAKEFNLDYGSVVLEDDFAEKINLMRGSISDFCRDSSK